MTTDAATRIPPHSLDAEESLLGAMLLSRDAIAAATDHCSADDLYKPAHGHIWTAIVGLYAKGEPVDAITVADGLRRHGLLDTVGGGGAILSMTAATHATSNAGRYARIVHDLAVLRRLIGAGAEITEIGYSVPEDVPAAVDRAETLLHDLAAAGTTRRDARPVMDILATVLDDIEARSDSDTHLRGAPTGFVHVDDLLLGLQPTRLYVIAARPGVGKTAFASDMARHAAGCGHPVLFASLEMSEEDLTVRMLASEALVDLHRLQRGNLFDKDWPRLTAATSRLGAMPLDIDETSAHTLASLRGAVRRAARRHGRPPVVIVDYLQLLRAGDRAERDRRVEVDRIAEGLAAIAKDMACPVVALSQLNRQLEARAEKRPMLSDLRESGQIEQAAHVVMFLYRDELYRDDDANKGVAEVIVAKNRMGPVGTATLAFLDQYTRFANMAVA